MTDLRYLSLGAGVQSTALLVMSNLGLRGCPKADVAIFADTQDEPQFVYDHLAWLEKWSKIPIQRVTAGRLSDAFMDGRDYKTPKERKQFVSFPAFTNGADGGMLRRQCTREFKIAPIEKKVRALLGYGKGQRISGKAIAMLGISLDEASRMRESRTPWIENTYPLIDSRMTRADCLKLIVANGIPIPKKSACVFCPYHDDYYWRELKEQHPKEFERAAKFDAAIRNTTTGGIKEQIFLHRSLVPLSEIDFSDPYKNQINMFENDCESGVCGV